VATAPGAIEDKERKEMRSMHLGLLHLGQFSERKAHKRKEVHAPVITAPAAIKAKEREENSRSIHPGHLGLLHLGQCKPQKVNKMNGSMHVWQSNPKKEKKGHEKHAPEANATQGNTNKRKYNNEKHAPGATTAGASRRNKRK
jgi:hypothetical protein